MMVQVRVPALGESVSEATVSAWFKAPGDAVAADEALCELETDKVTVEVPAPVAGRLGPILAPAGATVGVNAVLTDIDEGAPIAPTGTNPEGEAARPAPSAPTPTESGRMTDIMVPALGESVTEATVSTWFKKPGDAVKQDEMLCELETDKVSVEVPSPVTGILAEILAPEGATVDAKARLAIVTEGAPASATATAAPVTPAKAGAAPPVPAAKDVEDAPSAKRAMAEASLSRDRVQGTGRDGRIMKDDVAKPAGAAPAP
ncbi:MAG: biotin/lipoyl-containing protein, partial [Paracoccaceae bacterium]